MSSNDPMKLEVLRKTPPSTELFTAIGMVNYVWAELDALCTAALMAVLKIDPLEASVTFGRLDARAKIEKIRKITLHKKMTKAYEAATSISKMMGDEKKIRNAMTHGFYLGQSKGGEYCWSLLPDTIVTPQFSGNELFCTTDGEIAAHTQKVAAACKELLSAFEREDLRKLFALPSHVRSKLPPR